MKQSRRRRVRAHDLRGQYATVPSGPDLSTAIIDDPYGAPSDAMATREPSGDWLPPPRPQIVVVRTFKHDPIGRMHARRQITNAQYMAGRAYQELVEAANAQTNIGPGTWMLRGHSSSGSNGVSEGSVTDTMLRAGRRLRATDARIRARYGAEGIEVTRAVLIDRRRLDQLANDPTTDHGLRFWGFLLRRCLDEVAVLLGLTSRPR
jgi:hypothetical protein